MALINRYMSELKSKLPDELAQFMHNAHSNRMSEIELGPFDLAL